MRLLLLEDDYAVASEVRYRVESVWPRSEVVSIKNEADFNTRFHWTELEPPNLAILDVMLQSEAADGLRAGIRCLKRFRSSEKLAATPVILHTAVPWQSLREELEGEPHYTMYLEKQADLEQLFVQMRALLLALGTLPEESKNALWHDMWGATEIKTPGWVSIDLKKLWDTWLAKNRPAG